MKSSSDFLSRLPQSFLLIGPPGAGKTTVSLQLPKPFILDCDDNINGPIRFLKTNGRLGTDWFYDTPLRNADNTPCPREKQFDRASELLLEAINHPQIETIVISSLTAFVELAFTKTLLMQNKKLGDGKKTLDPKFEFAEWGAFAQIMKQTIMWLKASSKRLCIEAHIDVAKDELTGVLQNYIAIPGQLKTTLGGLFEEVWLLDVTTSGIGSTLKTERRIFTTPDNKSKYLGLKSASGLGSVFDADKVSTLQSIYSK